MRFPSSKLLPKAVLDMISAVRLCSSLCASISNSSLPPLSSSHFSIIFVTLATISEIHPCQYNFGIVPEWVHIIPWQLMDSFMAYCIPLVHYKYFFLLSNLIIGNSYYKICRKQKKKVGNNGTSVGFFYKYGKPRLFILWIIKPPPLKYENEHKTNHSSLTKRNLPLGGKFSILFFLGKSNI